MPHSKRQALFPIHYIDDSGEESSRFSLMGGPVFPRKLSFPFSFEWDRTMDMHKVKPPIHMRDFARPHGRLAYLSDDQRRALFYDLVCLINQNKIYSLTTVVDNLEFQDCFPAETFTKYMGASPLAYLWCLILNFCLMEMHPLLAPMEYVIAECDFSQQLTDCYEFWRSYELWRKCECNMPFSLNKPADLNALQAADMIAWANLKKHRGETFSRGFEPLELLTRYVESALKPGIHLHFPVKKNSTKKLAGILGMPNRKKGKRVSLLGTILSSPEIVDSLEQIKAKMGRA